MKKHLMLAAGAAALTACADGAVTSPQLGANPQLLTVAGSTYDPQSSYPLYAGGGGDGTGTLVGYVKVTSSYNAGTDVATFSVTYDINPGYCVTETHLAIALSADELDGKTGNPAPGQFPNSGTHTCVDGGNVTYSGIAVPMAGQNAVVIAAHSVVQGIGSPAVEAASYASGSSWSVMVTGRRDGSAGSMTDFPTPRPVVAAWEPFNNTDPSFWDTGITTAGPTEPGAPINGAAAIANGQWLLTNGADWVWEAFRSNQQLNPDGSTTTDALLPEVGAVVRMEASLTVAATTTGTFRITCDNGYRVFLNGQQISTDASPANFGSQLNTAFNPASTTDLKQANVSYNGWQSVEAYPVSLNAGANTFVIWGVNEYMRSADDVVTLGGPNHGSNGNIEINPAGCIFGVQVDAQPGSSTGEDTAWGALNESQGFTGKESDPGNFVGNNWASYIIYKVK